MKLLSNERKVELYKELIIALNKYMELILADYEETSIIASIHGWKCKRVGEGKIMRDEIESITNKLNV